MNRRISGFVLAGAIASAVPMLAGASAALNSEQSKSASQILKDAIATTRQARDFVIAGKIVSSGTSMSLDIVMSTHGGGGTITIPKATMDIITAGKFAFIKADSQTWKTLGITNNKQAATVAGQWIRVPSSTSGFSNFARLTYSNKFLNMFFSASSSAALTKQRGAHQFEGRPVIVLSSPQQGSIDVAATGKPYLLRIASPSNGASGSLAFSRFGTASVPKAPAHYITLPGL